MENNYYFKTIIKLKIRRRNTVKLETLYDGLIVCNPLILFFLPLFDLPVKIKVSMRHEPLTILMPSYKCVQHFLLAVVS